MHIVFWLEVTEEVKEGLGCGVWRMLCKWAFQRERKGREWCICVWEIKRKGAILIYSFRIETKMCTHMHMNWWWKANNSLFIPDIQSSNLFIVTANILLHQNCH